MNFPKFPGHRIHTHIFPLIQDKLGSALANWHPSDRSAKLMLKPWKAALPEGVFAAFLVKHIVPKLHICMQSVAINPHQQHLGKKMLSFPSFFPTFFYPNNRCVELGDGLE